MHIDRRSAHFTLECEWYYWERSFKILLPSNEGCNQSTHGLLLNRHCPHNALMVKVKDPRRSVSQLLRDPEVTLAEVTGFHWKCLFLASSSLFDAGEEALRWHVVYPMSDKMGLNWIHLRWTEQGFLIITYLFSTSTLIMYLLWRRALDLWALHKMYLN